MSFADKIRSFFSGRQGLSPEFFDDLADLLVEGDFDAREAYATAGLLRDACRKEKIDSPEDARIRLAVLLEETLRSGAGGGLPAGGPAVILMLGVNGVGKTTTAAKLAATYRDAHGLRPVLAAADTFRAAAIDQLKIHGERLGLRVVAHKPGGDPAAVVYDAIEAAQAGGGIVIADTAGRMHTKSALVEELRKVDRVVETKASGARYVKYLVLDSTTGRNAMAQAEIFCEAVSPEAAILTKYDSTARGGVVFSLASVLRLPVAYLCDGEKYGDIRPFDPRGFSREFAGVD
ncbi:MAG: signal recognition particle-docking protein FtsY [Treponema sp.]|nr:signal recognition particle-docking protein FtsY [Treponema sp.]